MKTQKEIMSEIESLKNYQNIIQDRIKSGNPNKGDKATVKTIKGDIKTLQWVLTP